MTSLDFSKPQKVQFRIDRALAERLNNLLARADKLSEVRGAYLLKKSEQDTFESRLIEAAAGKSQAEKRVRAQCTEEWLEFQKDLAIKFNALEDEKLIHDILGQAYQAEYLSLKVESEHIRIETLKRQGA